MLLSSNDFRNTVFRNTNSVSHSQLCLLPVAVVTNYHKFGGLNQQKFILSQFWIPDIQNQYC